MSKDKLGSALLAVILITIPLYPKFPLLGVGGTFVSVRLEDFLLLIVFFVWAIIQVRAKFPALREPTFRSILFYLFLGLVSLYAAIFVSKSVDPKLGLLHLFRRVEYMLLFPVAYSLVSSISHIKFLSRIIILVSVLIGCYGLGQQFLKFPVISTSNSEFSKGLALSLGPGARINSTFAGHYDLAAFSLLPVLLLFGLIITQPKHRIFYVLCGVPVYWAMILSASRVTYAAFLIVSSGLILINRKIFWFVPLICIALVSFIISPQLAGRYRELIINHLKFTLLPSAYAAVDEDLPDALQPPPVPEDRSLNIRLQAEWPRAIRAWLKNPLLGSGLSSTGLATDNDYLRLLAETGFLGLISFAAVITRIYKHIYQYFLSPPQDFRQLFIVTCGLYLFGILLNALFIDVFEASKIAIITWLVLGVASKATKINSNVIN